MSISPLNDVNFSIVKKINSSEDFLILDLASGKGELPREMSFLPHKLIFTIDSSNTSIANIKKYSIPTLYSKKMNVEDLDFEDNFFDVITFSRGIWIVDNYNKAILEINRVLKISGLVYFQLWTQSPKNLIFKKVSEILGKYSKKTTFSLKSIYKPSYKDLNLSVLNSGFKEYQKFLYEKDYSFLTISEFWKLYSSIAESAYLEYLKMSKLNRDLIDKELLEFFERGFSFKIEWLVLIYQKDIDGNK